MSSQDSYRTNSNEWSSSDPKTSPKRYVWEPYAISSPRRAIPMEEINQKKTKQEMDRDWLHAYVTYSPYRTSNQEYGAKHPTIHFIDTTRRNPTTNESGESPLQSRSNLSNPNVSPRSPQWK